MLINATRVFHKNHNVNTRFVVNQGGARSSKTYSLCQIIIHKCLSDTGKSYTIARESLVSAKRSVMQDFKDLLISYDLYNETNINKSEATFSINNNVVRFIGLDDEGKLRGLKHDVAWINEANDRFITYEKFEAINSRTREQVILDFNPSNEFHWIYDKVLTDPKCTFIQSTWRDNPFLPEAQIREIEKMKDIDYDYYRVFGLGERGRARNLVYQNYQICNSVPADLPKFYGLDFGYNVPTACVCVSIDFDNQKLYVDEVLYKTQLSNQDIIHELREIVGYDALYCDSAEPDRISELRRAGINAIKSNKDIKLGIDFIRSHKLYVTSRSSNVLKEIQNYKYEKSRDGITLEYPVKINDHSMDAMRYASIMFTKHSTGTRFTSV
jgi:phage terminase large subunit